MCDGETPALDVVDGDGQERRDFGALTIDEHDRDPRCRESIQRCVIFGSWRNQNPADPLFADQIEVRLLALQDLFAAPDKDDHAVVRSARLGAARDRCEEGVSDIEDDEAHYSAPPGSQLTSRVVAHISEGRDRVPHILDDRLFHRSATVEHVRHGADRNAGPRGDFADRDSQMGAPSSELRSTVSQDAWRFDPR